MQRMGNPAIMRWAMAAVTGQRSRLRQGDGSYYGLEVMAITNP